MLIFNAVGQLQTAIECPSCCKTGKDTEFTECCCKYVFELLGIQEKTERSDAPLDQWACKDLDRPEIGTYPLKVASLVLMFAKDETFFRDGGGFCTAFNDGEEESCKGYKPYPREFTNGRNSECQHHNLSGRCTL